MKLVTGLEKDSLLGCMGQVLQQGVDRIGEVGDRASEGQAAGVYGRGFIAVSGKGRSQGWNMGAGDQGSF